MVSMEALRAIDSYGKSLASSKKGRAFRLSPEKQEFDHFTSGVLRQVFRPLIRAMCFAVKMQDGGPGIIELPRVGYGGQIFGQRKIRSMHVGAELLRMPEGLKLKDDPRITKIGKLIRATSVDELPQFENAYEGTMSVVGPRPVPQEQFDAAQLINPGHAAAYGTPGITGLEQIGGRGKLELGERVALTLEYDEIACLALDRKIVASTIHAVITADGAY